MKSYQIKRKLGQGSFGMVFEAINNENKQQVAIKRSIKGKEYESKEVQILKEMNNSQHIIRLLDYFYTVNNIFPRYVEQNCLQLINQMFEYIPDKRITAKEALKHQFFNKRR